MNRKYIIGGLALLIAIVVAVIVIPENRKEADIFVGMSGGYKPYTFVDETGTLVGFEVDLWDEIGRRIGKSVEYKISEFSGLFGMLDSGKITTIANQITVNPGRLEKYDFSDPYVYYGAQLVVKSNNDQIVDLESLRGKRVGVSLGSNYEQMVRDFDVDGEIEVVTYENFQGSLQDVSLGRLDAVLNDRLAGLTTIKEAGLDLQFGGEPVEWLFNSYPFVKNEENRLLISEINKALADMKSEGVLENISLKWFGVNITEQ